MKVDSFRSVRSLAAGMLAVALLFVAPSAGAMPAVTEEGLVMTVSGAASRLLVNDEAVLAYAVEARRPDAAAANEAVTTAAAGAVKALEALGAGIEVRTADFSTWAVTTRPKEGEAARVEAWASRETIRVTVRDLRRLPDVMSAAGGTMQLDGVTFSVSRGVREAARNELLAEAIRNAADRAVTAAKALGLDEGNVRIEGITTGGTAGPSPRFYAQPQALMARSKADANAGALAAGSAETTVDVTVSVRIRP